MKWHFPIIILAAGQSSRMRGAGKLLENVRGRPLLRQQVQNALAVTDGPVLVALPVQPHPRYGAIDDLDAIPIPVPDAGEGMNASLRTAFAALPKEAPCAMLLLADLPDLTQADLRTVADAVDLTSDTLVWRGATQDGAPGHPIVFRSDLFDAFQTLVGDSGGRDVIAQAQGRITRVPLKGDRARRDLDTPEDWDVWRAENEVKKD